MRPKFRVPTESWVLYALFLALCLVQRWGEITNDTRLELATRPASFLAGTFNLWSPETNFGEIQNQAYGYLFPQGAWFALWDWVGLPTWVSQRLWMALLLVLAAEGTRRVALAVGLGRGAAFLAGLAFAFAPRLVSTLGVISAETVVSAMLPWLLLPVVLVVRGWMRPWRAAVLSGAAVVCMGGVNAVEVLGALPLPLIMVLWAACVGLTTWRFVAQWCGMVALAGTWWMLPLLVLGKYSPAFYAWVESSSNTTGLIGPARALRGSTHWVGLLQTGGQPWWPAAFEYASSNLLIVVAALVQVLGLVGLVAWRNRLRTPFFLAVLLSFAALTVSHVSWGGSPVADTVRALLDGPIQMFRNVHKIDPTLRLPIAIGFGWLAARAVHRCIAWLREHWPRRLRAEEGEYGWMVFAAPLLLLALLAQPLWTGNTRIPGWDEANQPWTQAHDYLVAEQGDTRTLVVPGTGFSQTEWGWSLEEPLLSWDDVNFASRTMVPLIPGSSIRFLTALNDAIVGGGASADLVQVLRSAGVGHLLVRRDLDRAATGSPDPRGAARSAQNMRLDRVAAFGPAMQGGQQIEIYEVPGASAATTTTQSQDVLTVAGSIEGVVDLRDAGLVDADTPVVLDGEENWDASPDIVTDTNTRRERAFGTVNDNLSQVMQADEDYRVERTVHDYPGSPSAEVVASYAGVRLVTASSSVAYADTWGTIDPASGPFAVLDSDPRTRWISSPGQDAEGQWVRIDFAQQRRVGTVSVATVMSDGNLGQPRELEVSVNGVSRRVQVNPTGTRTEVDFSSQRSDHVLVRFTRVSGPATAQVAISDIRIEGLTPTRSLDLPDEVGANAQVMLSTEPGTPACQPGDGGAKCNAGAATLPSELAGMRRTVTWSQASDQIVQGQVVPRANPYVQTLVKTQGSGQLTSGSSVLGEDLLASAVLATDGDPATAWRPDSSDTRPTFSVMWSKPHLISGIELSYAQDVERLPNLEVLVDGKPRKGYFQGGTFRFYQPWRGTEFSVRFARTAGADFGVAEINALGYDMERPIAMDAPIARFCGTGPQITVGDAVLATRIDGTVADLLSGHGIDFQVCGQVSEESPLSASGEDLTATLVSRDARALTAAVPRLAQDGTERPVGSPRQVEAAQRSSRRLTVSVEAGRNVVSAEASAEFTVTRIVLTPATLSRHSSAQRATEVVAATQSTSTIEVGPGDEGLVVMPQNHNIGWRARVGDHVLVPVRIDGWMQAWVLPASTTTDTVRVTFLAERSYRQAMAFSVGTAGGVLVLGIFALAWPRIQRRRYRRLGGTEPWPEDADRRGVDLTGESPWRRRWSVPLLLAVLVLLGPLTALTAVAGRLLRRISSGALLGAAAVLGTGSGLASTHGSGLPERVPDAMVSLCLGLLLAVVLRPTASPDQRPARPTLPNWRGVPGFLAAVIIVASVGWSGWLARGSYWHQDDLVMIGDAARTSLTWSHLFSPMAGHLVPGQRLVHWLLTDQAPFSWPAAVAVVLVAQALALGLLWTLLNRLLPGRPVRLVFLTVAACSSLGTLSTLSLHQALNVWPPIVALLGALIFFHRWAAGDGRATLNAVGILGCLVLGLAWGEQSLLIVVVLAAAAVLHQPGHGWRRAWQALVRWRWVALALTLVVGATVALNAQRVGAAWAGRSVGDFWDTLASLVGRVLVPSLLGGPWQAEVVDQVVVPATWVVVLACLAGVIGLVWALRHGGSVARWTLLFAVVLVLVDTARISFGSGSTGASAGLENPSTMLVLLALLVLAAMLLAARDRGVEQTSVPAPRSLGRLGAGLLVVAFAVSSTVTTAALAPHLRHDATRTYVENLQLALAWSPAAVFLDRPVPEYVVSQDFGTSAQASKVFAALPGRPAFDLPQTSVSVIRPDGYAEPFSFDPASVQRTPARADRTERRRKDRSTPRCWATMGPGESLTWQATEPARGAQVLQISYSTTTAWDLQVQAGDTATTFRTSYWGQVQVPLGEQDLDRVTLVTPSDYDGTLCVVAMKMGRTDVDAD